MTKDASLELSKADIIRDVLRFYHEDFTEYYATVIALTEKMPEQINNEIRNAFSHLARTGAAASIEDAKKEANQACGHIERACRDCLKASIIAVHDNIENLTNHAMVRYKAIDPKNTAERRAVRNERLAIVKAETKGENELTQKFKELLERSLTLQISLEDYYGTAKWKMPLWAYIIWKRFSDAIHSGIGKGIGLVIVGLIVEDKLNLIDAISKWWHTP